VTEHYMSANDIAFCREYDIGGVASGPGFAAIQILHQKLNDLYPPEEETEAARFPIALRQNTRALLEAFEPIVRDRDLTGTFSVMLVSSVLLVPLERVKAAHPLPQECESNLAAALGRLDAQKWSAAKFFE